MISRTSAEDFISNEEAIIRKGLDSMSVSHDNLSEKHLKKSVVRKRNGITRRH